MIPIGSHAGVQANTEVPNAPAMSCLRAGTRDLHEALEADPRVMRQFETRAGLAKLLSSWYGFLLPFEVELIRNAVPFSDFIRSRSKLHALCQDLAVHGISPSRVRQCEDLPEVGSCQQVFGALYVLEGSTLGGRMLAGQIEKHLGLHDGVGYSFFLGYGIRTGSMWHEFSDMANRFLAASASEAISAARSTFSCLHRWLAA